MCNSPGCFLTWHSQPWIPVYNSQVLKLAFWAGLGWGESFSAVYNYSRYTCRQWFIDRWGIHTSYFSLYDFSGGWFTGYKCTLSYDYIRKKDKWSEAPLRFSILKWKRARSIKWWCFSHGRPANICKASKQPGSIQLYFGFTLLQFNTLKLVE